MEISDIIQIGFTVGVIGVSSSLLAMSLDVNYIGKLKKLQEQGKLKKIPLYAQELSKAAKKTFDVFNKKGTLRSLLHYHFYETPTLKAAYNFLTLNNPENRSLFFD